MRFLRNRRPAHPLARMGFTLIELAIVLGVVGVLAGGLWRLMSAGSQQTRDQNTAAQHSALISAIKGYLAETGANGGQAWMQGMAPYTAYNLPLPSSNTSLTNCKNSAVGGSGGVIADICNYLPTGFSSATTNPYGQTYTINVLKDGTAAGTIPQSYSFMIVTSGGTAIPDSSGGRISGLIGGDGGFIYNSTTVCGGTYPTACGALGAWQIANITIQPNGNPALIGYAIGGGVGSIASRTFVSPDTSSSFFWLARIAMPGDSATYTYNTMTTDMFMGAWQGAGVTPLSGSSAYPALHLQNGYIDGTGSKIFGQPQLKLVTDPTTFANSGASLVALSNGGCTALSTNGLFTSCLATLSVTGGDISVPNGEVSAKKVYSASDFRLKKDIHPIEDPLASLMKVAPVSFAFKDGGSKGMGVIAQDLEKIYPELVLDTQGTKYVEYNGLIGPLIGAVQELKRQNDDLRDQLRAQAAREDRLEQELGRKSAAP